MRLTRILVLFLLATAGSAASGQLDPRVKPGARVRFSAADAEIIGRVVGIRADTIVVDRGPADSAVALPLADARALAVYSRGKSAEALATTFGVVGAAAGAGLYVSWCARHPDACRELERQEQRDRDDDDDCDEEPMSLLATMTTAFGALGMLIGYALAPQEWRAVDLPVRVGLAPLRHGVMAYVSVATW